MALTQTADQLIPELAPRQRQLILAGGVGLLVSLVALITNRPAFFQAYLMGYMFCLGLTLGCLAFGMIHQLSGGAWGVVVRRPLGAASRVLPVLTILFIPIVLGMRELYGWTDAARVASDEAVNHKEAWLNVPFFLGRAVIYFAVWNALAFFLNRWSLDQDRTNDPIYADRMARLSGGGLVIYGITITFASFDWLMSLEPDWYSTIFGLLIIVGQGLLAIAFLIAVLVWLSRRDPLNAIIAPVHFHDLGNLMLAFTMLWAYMAFSQLLIIWAGNLPAEIQWYAHRLQTNWRYLGLFLVVFHFFVPFILLLMRAIKRTGALVIKLAAFVLAVRWADFYWIVVPSFHRDGISISWVHVLLPAAMFAVWLGCFVWQLRQRPLLPIHDPQFDQALGRLIARSQHAGPRTVH